MTLKEELKSKQDALVALKARIEANDAEAIAEGEKLKAEIEAKTAEIQQAEKKSALLGMIGTTDKKEDDAMSEVKTARTLGEHFVKNMPESHGSRFSISAPEFIKAYSDPMAVGTVASPQVPAHWSLTSTGTSSRKSFRRPISADCSALRRSRATL